MSDLYELDAVTCLSMFRRHELSPVELMRALIARTEQVNPQVNALTETFFDEALEAAQRAEAVYRQGGEAPALLGLPVATKEKHAIAGRRLSQGLVAHRYAVADESHPVVDRVAAAGGIVHARTTTPEYSCATVTHGPLWGVTRNPWDLSRSPGGSSGGSAAALAAGIAALATGSDIAGSVRVPAAFTGTVGYKAPYGRIPGMPPLSADPYRGDGPMARTVADAALFANVLFGRDPRDHSSLWPSPTVPGTDGGVADARVALCVRLGDHPVPDQVAADTRAVAEALEDAGAAVEEVELPWSSREVNETAFTHFGHILGPAMQDATAGLEGTLAAYTEQFIADARAAAGRNRYLDALAVETRMQSELAAAMDGFDVLLSPTSAVPALAADGDYLDGITVESRRLQHYWEAHMTVPFNICNRCPVLAVPTGARTAGTPTGVQVVGHPYDDVSVFRVGAAVERLRPASSTVPLDPR